MHRVSSLLIVAAILTMAAFAWAGNNPNKSQRSGRGDPFIKAVFKLNLTDAQKSDIAGLLKKNQEQRRQNFESLRKAMDDLAEVSYKDGGNEAAVREAYKALAAAGETVALAKAASTYELKKLLTPEQLKQLDEKRAKKMEKMKRKWAERRDHMDAWIDKNAR